ncbi:MAG: recombinase family protein [Eggerthellaceae bacterium]|nr:recombinase family protein [Eggerthellaceae bacterium]
MSRNAAIYARFSCSRQNEVSIEDQVLAGRGFAEANGLDVVGVYSDRAMSGTSDARPGLQRMMRDSCRHAFDYVVIWHTDRIHRNMLNAFSSLAVLFKNDVQVLSVTQPELNTGADEDEDKNLLLWSVYAWKDMRYSKDLSKNVKRGMQSRADKCLYLGHKVFGYDHDKDRRFVVNEDEAAVVAWCFGVYAAGRMTLREMADDLNRRGHRSARGNPLGYNFVEAMLRREAYIGRYWYKGRLVSEDGYPRIVGSDLFAAVQEHLGRKRRKAEKGEYLLLSKLFCSSCKKRMVGKSGYGRAGKAYYYYVCSGRHTSCITDSGLHKDVLEQAVADAVLKTLGDHRTAEHLIGRIMEMQETGPSKDRIDGIARELEAVERRQGLLLDAIDSFPPHLLAKKADELQGQRLGLESEMGRLKAAGLTLTRDDLREYMGTLSNRLSVRDVIENLVMGVTVARDGKLRITTSIPGADGSLVEAEGGLPGTATQQ